jgi:DNA-binding CsgD family transcriptional regulator
MSNLTDKQRIAIRELAQGSTINETAELIELSPKTIKYWLTDLEFRAELAIENAVAALADFDSGDGGSNDSLRTAEYLLSFAKTFGERVKDSERLQSAENRLTELRELHNGRLAEFTG